MPVRPRLPRLRAPRPLGALAAAALLALPLAGCGGEEPVELDGEPLAAEPTQEPQVSDEQQLRDLVDAYDASLDEAQRLEGDPAAFEGVLTDELAATFGRNYRENIYGNDLEMTGSWSFEVGTVEVADDEATVEVCTDGRDVYVLPAGTKIGPGDTNQGRSPQTLTATRSGERWLIAAAASGGEACR